MTSLWIVRLVVGTAAATAALGAAQPAAAGEPRVAPSYGQIALGFEPNRGQSEPGVRFLSRGSGYGMFLTQREILLALGKPSDPSVLRISPLGASPRVRLIAGRRLSGRVNYLTGRAHEHSPTSVPAYRSVTYQGIYRGIDLVLHGNQRELEYDFVVAPGSAVETIRLAFPGADDISVAPSGDLIIKTGRGQVRQRKPIAYQDVGGVRHRVRAAFSLRRGEISFSVGDYDRTRPLVIDPVVEYSTFLGSVGSYDQAQALAVGEDGAAYVAGLTFGADFPTTGSAFDPGGHGQTPCAPLESPGFQPPPVDHCRSDAFVSKLKPDGRGLVYSTFLGGAKSDRIQDIAVDHTGAAYVAGGTDSDDFPTTAGALDPAAAGKRRVMGAGLVVLSESFVAKLNPDGSKLEYSTLLGGADAEEAMGVSVSAAGDVYVTGHTFSQDYPTTPDAFDTGLNTPDAPPNVCSDIFVTKVDPGGATLRYSTLVGGSRLDFGWELDVDETGAAYVIGESTGSDAPTTPGAFQRTGHVRPGRANPDCSAPLDQFDDADPLVVKVTPDGSVLEYSTYLGGDRHEHGLGIAEHEGFAYIVGHTNSTDFPTTPGAFDRFPKATSTLFDGFAAKLAPAGDRLEYSTLLGGVDDDWVFEVDVDEAGTAYLTGMTSSSNFPTTEDALDASYVGPGAPFYDAFLTRLAADGSTLLYSSYFGGSGPDVGLGVVADGEGSAYIAGTSYSPDMPVSVGAFSPVFKGPPGYSDAFVSKFSGFSSTRGDNADRGDASDRSLSSP